MKKKEASRIVNCGDCHEEKMHWAKELCQNCYYKFIWRNNAERRAKHKKRVYAWRDAHPKRWKKIQAKATAKARKKYADKKRVEKSKSFAT